MSLAVVQRRQLQPQHRLSRYEQVMGDRPPRVTDRQFVNELTAKLDLFNLSGQRSKEHQLADAEKKRQLRLIAAALLNDANHSSVAAPASRPRKHRKRKKRSKTKTPTASLSGKLAPVGNALEDVQNNESGDDSWSELWPPNPTKSLTDNRREAFEYQRIRGEEKGRFVAKRFRQQQSTAWEHKQSTECTDEAADSSGSCASCDNDNRYADTGRLSCDMTVEQLYKRAARLHGGSRF